MADISASVPNPAAGPQMVYSDPSALASLAQTPGLLVPADAQTAMNRTYIDWAAGMNDTNSTPAARAQYPNMQGFSTDYSATVPDGKYAVVIPQVVNGKLYSERESRELYLKSKTPQKPEGNHFGKFDLATEEATKYKNSDAYANKFHQRPLRFEDGKKIQ